MTDSTAVVPPVRVCGRMGGVSSETDSSDESSEGDVEIEFEGNGSASPSCIVDSNVMDGLPGERCKQEEGGARVVENGRLAVGEQTPPATSKSTAAFDPGTNVSANVPDRTRFEGLPMDNAFGIAYEPLRGSSQKSYDLPSGPAFVDEDEFEQEMSAEFRVAVGPSRQGEAFTTISNRTPADDFVEGDGTADSTMGTQQVSCRGAAHGAFCSSKTFVAVRCLRRAELFRRGGRHDFKYRSCTRFHHRTTIYMLYKFHCRCAHLHVRVAFLPSLPGCSM